MQVRARRVGVDRCYLRTNQEDTCVNAYVQRKACVCVNMLEGRRM